MAALTYAGANKDSGALKDSGAFNETASGNKTGTEKSSQTQAQNQTQTLETNTNSIKGVNIANMSSGALTALESLIQSLSDRPTISREQAMVKLANAPSESRMSQPQQRATYNADRYGQFNGWGFTDHLGNTTDYAGYQKALKLYDGAVQSVQDAGGITPGGTVETTNASTNFKQELDTVRRAREGYGKDDAFADSRGAMDAAMRQTLEKIMPDINAIVEGSGTSGGAVAGILKGDAAMRAAEAAATLGIKAAVDYGNIFNQQSQITGDLIQKSPIALNALLKALDISKGSIQSGSNSENTGGKNVTTTVGTGNSSGNKTAADTSTGTKEANRSPYGLTNRSSATDVYGNFTF